MKTYHGNCADVFNIAWIVRNALSDNAAISSLYSGGAHANALGF